MLNPHEAQIPLSDMRMAVTTLAMLRRLKGHRAAQREATKDRVVQDPGLPVPRHLCPCSPRYWAQAVSTSRF